MASKRTIRDRYEILEKLGEGGMGIVYRAHDRNLDREVALKTLLESPDRLTLELFYKETQILKTISHPNIVEIFDTGEFDEGGYARPFFVMPLLPGQTLDVLIRDASHRLTVERVVDIVSQTCRGLQAAHERGLVHRDLKPSNVFVMSDDSVKIIDFGVARVIDARSRSEGYDKGTLLYMAPEQVQDQTTSPQSDIFSLGVVAYEALTRRQPFRAATEAAVKEAIRTLPPPPASEINPQVSRIISRVIHKALAKQAWNRYDSAKVFGDTLQKALRNESIELFDPSKIQPRVERATKALERGDTQFAHEIVSELEAAGNIDVEIAVLRVQIDQVTRQRTIAQLLESARARFEEEEDPLVLLKVQEVLQLDPHNATALLLKGKVEDRRSERQIENWLRVAHQHVANHSYGHARDALKNVLDLRPQESRARRLLKEIETEEQEYLQRQQQKAGLYQSALNAWKNGDVSHALTQMKRLLEIDADAPDTSTHTGTTYESFYNKIRSEHDALNNGYAEARRCLEEQEFDKALRICKEFLDKYPGQALFQALKYDIEERQRQRLSAFIADVDRRLEAESDLDTKYNLLREAVSEYPEEPHFKRSLKLIADKRDLVNAIVARFHAHEERGELREALGDLDTLQTIYSPYPGLRFERERVEKRLAQQTRDAARVAWITQIDRQLEAASYPRALELLDRAQREFPDEAEFVELRKLAQQGLERATRAEELLHQGQDLCRQGQFDDGVDVLRSALQFDDRPSIQIVLRDVLISRAQALLESDVAATEKYAASALELDANNALARSLRAQAQDKRREAAVGQFASQARRMQADGDIPAAVAEVQKGLADYPADPRLTVLLDTLNKELGHSRKRARISDLEQLHSVRREAGAAEDTGPQPITDAATVAADGKPDEDDSAIANEVRQIVEARAGRNVAVVEGAPRKAAAAGGLRARLRAWTTGAGRPVSPTRRRIVRGALVASAVGSVVIVALVMPRPAPGPETPPPDTPTPAVGAGANPDNAVPEQPLTSGDQPPVQPEVPISSPRGRGVAPLPTSSPATTAPTKSAMIVMSGLVAGVQVTIDGTPAGTTDREGNLTIPQVTLGNHTLQFSRRGYDALTVVRPITEGGEVTLTAADVVLKPSPASLSINADPGTTVTVASADGQIVRQVTGPSTLNVAAGTYTVVSTGAANVPISQTVSLGNGERKAVRAAVVSGMERFDRLNTWMRDQSWFSHRGGGFVLYDRAHESGRITFTVMADRSRNPFSNGPRLKWVVGFVDQQNYVLVQLDDRNLYRTEVVNGKPRAEVRTPHSIRSNGRFVYLSAEVNGTRLVHQYSQDGKTWRSLDSWDRPAGDATTPPLSDGKFGFYLPGSDQVSVSNFLFYPIVPE